MIAKERLNAGSATEPSRSDFDPDTVNHWMRKSDITRGIISGAPAKALCGTVFTPSSHSGETSNVGAMICPLCQLVYEGIPE